MAEDLLWSMTMAACRCKRSVNEPVLLIRVELVGDNWPLSLTHTQNTSRHAEEAGGRKERSLGNRAMQRI